jgi:hypothetical protein
VAQAFLRLLQRGVEALELRGDLVVADHAVRDVRHLPEQDMHQPFGDAARCRDAAQGALH